MIHANPMINDIVLSVINDGDGSMCGASYNDRLEAARHHEIFRFREMAREYARYNHRVFKSRLAERAETIEAGNYLMEYYENHLKEMEDQ